MESLETTFQLFVNKTHVGPFVKKGKAGHNVELTKAAAKIKFNKDLTIKLAVKQDDQQQEGDGTSPSGQANKLGKTSYSVLNPSDLAKPQLVVAMFEGFNLVTKGAPGTKEYVVASNKLSAAKAEFYRSQNLPLPEPKKPAPKLTMEQRMLYNEVVGPFAFDYFEVRLSYREPKHNAVRSKTYRYLRQPDMVSLQKKILAAAREWAKDKTFSVKPNN